MSGKELIWRLVLTAVLFILFVLMVLNSEEPND